MVDICSLCFKWYSMPSCFKSFMRRQWKRPLCRYIRQRIIYCIGDAIIIKNKNCGRIMIILVRFLNKCIFTHTHTLVYGWNMQNCDWVTCLLSLHIASYIVDLYTQSCHFDDSEIQNTSHRIVYAILKGFHVSLSALISAITIFVSLKYTTEKYFKPQEWRTFFLFRIYVLFCDVNKIKFTQKGTDFDFLTSIRWIFVHKSIFQALN